MSAELICLQTLIEGMFFIVTRQSVVLQVSYFATG